MAHGVSIETPLLQRPASSTRTCRACYDLRARCSAQRPRRARPLGLRELGRADLLGPRAQRGDRGHDVERGLPLAEALGLLGDDRLGPLRLAPPAGEALGDDRLEVVDVVEVAAVELVRWRGRGRAGRRGRSGTAAGPCAGTGGRRPRAREHEARARSSTRRRRRPRRARPRARSSASGSAPKRAASSSAALASPVGDERRSSAPRADEAPGRELADLARRRRAARAARRGRRRPAARARRRQTTPTPGSRAIAVSRPHLLAGVQRLAEEPVEHGPGRAGLVRGAHLAEDLALAGHERVEPGGDAEEVQAAASSCSR